MSNLTNSNLSRKLLEVVALLALFMSWMDRVTDSLARYSEILDYHQLDDSAQDQSLEDSNLQV